MIKLFLNQTMEHKCVLNERNYLRKKSPTAYGNYNPWKQCHIYLLFPYLPTPELIQWLLQNLVLVSRGKTVQTDNMRVIK